MNAITTNRLSEIVETVNIEHAEIESALREGLTRAVNVGNLLNEAKQLVKHGEWGNWISDNCQFSERTAQNYMRIAARYPELIKSATVADLTYREAVALLAEPKAEGVVAEAESWIERIQWSVQEWKEISALCKQIDFECEQERTATTPARGMLLAAQALIHIEERDERLKKYFDVMFGAMRDASQDEIFPLLRPELQQKVLEWIE